MVHARKWLFVSKFKGFPKRTDLTLVEKELRPIKDGEFVAKAVYLSVDPYMRKYADSIPLNSVMIGRQIALITESKNDKYPVGKHVTGDFGWRTHTLSDGQPSVAGFPVTVLPNYEGLPLSLALGVLGMSGRTAFLAFLEHCKPKPAETVVVSGAAGSVGSHVGQIAKIKGCKVIGIAGSEEKGEWLTKKLGFNHFINYKTEDIAAELQKVAPQGVDCYFDNVGGELSTTVLKHMNDYGRVSVVGSISGDSEENPKATPVQLPLVTKQLTMVGFRIRGWKDRWNEADAQNLEWIKQGKLKYEETITEGFENMFSAFTDMLSGGNKGKALVKI